MFIKFIITVFISISFISGFSQHTLKNHTIIDGKVSEEDVRENDIIYFTNGMLDSQFYEFPSISSDVNNNLFKVKTTLTYPHLYTVSFESEKPEIRFRGGDYFIDPSTDFLEVSALKLAGCNYVKGATFNEYKTKFIPYFASNSESCTSATIQSLSFKNGVEFDDKLLSYTLENQDSYVALWALIIRIRFQGHSPLYETILDSFSDKIKKEKLWKIVHNDLQSIRINKGNKFPKLNLKNLQHQSEILTIHKAEYILVYYWFSNCKPCLESFPHILNLYKKYKSKGFEIVSISVDRTSRISNWEKVIKEYELTWKNLLDENGKEAKKDKITTFPTTFLLDSDGKVLEKNITIGDLEEILRQI